MDDFTRSYLGTALWSSNDESTPEGGEPMDRNFDVEDISAEAVAAAEADCNRFRAMAAPLVRALTGDDFDPDDFDDTAAHDFWLTRNGHGAGFWDGDYPVTGDALTELCKRFREVSLYVGDDGELYHFDG